MLRALPRRRCEPRPAESCALRRAAGCTWSDGMAKTMPALLATGGGRHNGRVDADHLSAQIQERTARNARIDGAVRLNAVANGSATSTAATTTTTCPEFAVEHRYDARGNSVVQTKQIDCQWERATVPRADPPNCQTTRLWCSKAHPWHLLNSPDG